MEDWLDSFTRGRTPARWQPVNILLIDPASVKELGFKADYVGCCHAGYDAAAITSREVHRIDGLLSALRPSVPRVHHG